jgi:hypothetical protein
MRAFVAAGFVIAVALAPVRAQTDPSRPDPARTPGAVNADITAATVTDTICNPRWSTKSIRPSSSYTTRLKREQMRALGYTVSNPLPEIPTKNGRGVRFDLSLCVARSSNVACYEEDHLISLELGGHPTDPKNLWPEPRNGPLNAHDKDRLENELHRQVCAATITLEAAQQTIASDWVAAYQQYVDVTPQQ